MSHLCQYSSSLFFILLHIQFFQLFSLSLQLLGRFSKISLSSLQISLSGIEVANLHIGKVCFSTKILIESGINIFQLAMKFFLCLGDFLALRENIVASLIHGRILLLKFLVCKHRHFTLISNGKSLFVDTDFLNVGSTLIL